jgi:hypothetical protein
MTLFELVKRIGQCCLNLLNIYKSLKKKESSKEYNITSFSLNRSFHLKTSQIASGLENQTCKLFKENIQVSIYRKELENLLHAPEKMALQHVGDLVW